MAKNEKVTVRVPQEDGEIILSRGTGNKRHYPVKDHTTDVDDADLAHILVGVDGAHVVRTTKARETNPATSKPDSPESMDGRLNTNGSNSPNGDSERL